MKKIVLILCVLFLYSSSYAGNIDKLKAVIAAKNAGGGCGTQTNLTDAGEATLFGYDANYAYEYTGFSAGGTGTYSVKTIWIYLKDSGSPNIDVEASLCTDSGGAPGSCTPMDSYYNGQPGNLCVPIKFNISAGYEMTAGTTYNVRVQAQSTSTDNYYRYCYSPTGDYDTQRSSDGAGWSSIDSSSTAAIVTSTCLE